MSAPTPTPTEIDQVFREHYGRAVATLIRTTGDIDLAEDAVQDAFATAVARWSTGGIPPSPAGWLITTARNRAVDRLRREATLREALDTLISSPNRVAVVVFASADADFFLAHYDIAADQSQRHAWPPVEPR